MIYKPPVPTAASVLLAIVYLVGSIGIGTALPKVRDRHLPSGGSSNNEPESLDHRMGILLHKIAKPKIAESSSSYSEYNFIGIQKSGKIPVMSELRSDVRAAVFVLRETQLQMLSALSVQIKIQEKLAQWAPHIPKVISILKNKFLQFKI